MSLIGKKVSLCRGQTCDKWLSLIGVFNINEFTKKIGAKVLGNVNFLFHFNKVLKYFLKIMNSNWSIEGHISILSNK